MTPLATLRSALAGAVRSRVESDPSDVVRIFTEPGQRWFAEGAPIRIVHSDAAMFVGGLRALVLQALHPLAMAGVADHSGFRGDPWGRLQRTSRFLAATTFGSVEVAERAIARVHGVHRRIVGTAPDGRPYAADDPHLLLWVHLAEIDSFVRAHRRFGAVSLTPDEYDQYVVQTGIVAAKLGVVDPPQSVAEVRERLRVFRPELRGTGDARDTARYLLFTPPMPLAARPAYGLIATAAISTLPSWARRMLLLPPPFPVADRLIGEVAGQLATRTFRWALTAERPAAS